MKITENITTPTLLMSSPSSLILRKNKFKVQKPFKFNRRLNSRMASLAKNSAPLAIPINSYQIFSVSSPWTNTQWTSPNPMIVPINPNPSTMNIASPPALTSSLINQQQQNPPIYPLSKPFTTPRITTTLIPLNVCPTEYCQTVRPTPIPTPPVNIIAHPQKQSVFESKSNGVVTTHLIGDWIIRESVEPFQRKENERLTPIKQLLNQEKNRISSESNTPCQFSSTNIDQWTIDDVCSFFERVLEKNCYRTIIKEHLIDGAALLLLEEEHLTSIFKMPLGPRLKLLNRINQLKNGDLSQL